MRLFKFFITAIFISSFLATSVSSKLISFCMVTHHSEKSHSKEITHDKPCHSSTKEKKQGQFCVECDCYLNKLLGYVSETTVQKKFFKSSLDKPSGGKHLVEVGILDPPPKKIFKSQSVKV